MKDAIRVILIDPAARSRQALQGQIEGLRDFDLIEVSPTYESALKRVAALSPDMAIVVVDADVEQAMALIEAVSRSYPGVALVPAGSDGDATAMLRAMRAGAREYLPLPAGRGELLETVRRVCPSRVPNAPTGPRGPQVIAVTGATGGVGCTSMSVNLATTLAKLSRRDTVLADFDLLLGSLEDWLAVACDNTMEMIINNLDEVDPPSLKRWLPRHTSGLAILPHPVSMEEAARLDPDSLRRVLGLLRETYCSVVIDTSKGLQATDFLAYDAADVILVVVQLNLNCTRNTVRLLQYFRQFEGLFEKVRVVVNRFNSPLTEISVKKAEELLKTQVSWLFPNATKLLRPARIQSLPLDEVEGGAGSKAHEAMLAIARELQPYPAENVKPRKTLFSAFR